VNGWSIRAEYAGDAPAIAALAFAAFDSPDHSGEAEREIVERLRADGDLTLSLVAIAAEGEIVGHAAFSPVRINGEAAGWFGLGPVSVAPAHQGSGVGSALIREGLARLAKLGAKGCVVLGSPTYYGRFGFASDPALVYPAPPAKYFQTLVMRGEAPQGEVSYSAAFG
jgi:putative acetyltransferase